MARTYKRDANGRFAGGGGGGSRAKPVTLTRRKPVSQGGGKSRGNLLKRQAVKSAKSKLAAKDPGDQTIKGALSRRSQKGAVTRAQRQLKAAQQSGSVRLKARSGVVRVGRKKGGPKKPGTAATAKPAAKSAKSSRPRQRVDYSGAVKLLSGQSAAIKRLKNPQQTFNGNASYSRQLDILRAKSTPMANARRDIRSALGDYRRRQATARNPLASPEMRARATREIPGLRKAVVKAARVARAFKPEYAPETSRRFKSRRR